RLLQGISRWPKTMILVVLLMVGGTAATLPFFGGEFLPEFREGHFVCQISMAPGTSMDAMLRLGKQIAADLLKSPHIQSAEQQIGRAEMGEDTWGPHRSEIHVELKRDLPGEDQEAAEKEIRDVLGKYPGIQFEVLTFLGDRLGETISGETAEVVVNV